MGPIHLPQQAPHNELFRTYLCELVVDVDPNGLISLFNDFDDLRSARLQRAQEFLSGAGNLEELFADVANIMMIGYTALRVADTPKGFQSTGT